jgi:hypothetical protein
MNSECYLKVKDNMYYKIENGKATSINISKDYKGNRIKDCKCLPTAYMKDVIFVSKEEYENVEKEVNNV